MQSLYYTKKYNSRVSERFYVEATAALVFEAASEATTT